MITDVPVKTELRPLKALWKEAFGDTDAFIDSFFETAYSADRCCCLTEKGQLTAALYWLDCALEGNKIAYIYAVATAREFQGRGLCRELMRRTHRQLEEKGYAGAVLVPGSESLFRMYEKMGYRACSGVREFSCKAGDVPEKMRQLSTQEYARLRRQLLPPGGVIQEGENLPYLAAQASLYGGEGFAVALVTDGKELRCMELLGDATRAPGIVKALNAQQGHFRVPGQDKPFAMYYSISEAAPPDYFGLAFD